MTNTTSEPHNDSIFKEAIVVFSLAVLAAVLIKLPSIFGYDLDQNENLYFRNMSFFALPLVTAYFAWKRELKTKTILFLTIPFLMALTFANIYPFEQHADTEVLLALHLPVTLWLLVGIAFSGRQWRQSNERMNFIRFYGESFIYYVLIALGGGVLSGFMALIFGTIDIDIEPFFESWLLPCGATGAIIIAVWLAEIRSNLAANFAPVLAKLFSPLFAIMLITFLGVMAFTGKELITDREVLIAFDLLLIVVLALLLYSISARNSEDTPGVFDVIQVVLVVSALIADAVALLGISERIAEFGFTPNRVAALGLNLILLVNLIWSVVLYIRFLRGKSSFSVLEKWQTGYLTVYAAWGAIVVIVFPLLFGFE
ncbi:hypothetical protein [Gracilimonas sp.]|uniref:hypothetical protein n=1 Tax=Gracilimonas sp. TaxID=1974203 RepID=UPI002871799F|nr:hypothetical protein [Gracilimonas sp.]